ncbi:MAG: 5-carboxymethyl-2-hydroxymuconate isomerase [Pseudomonadota bacterium]
MPHIQMEYSANLEEVVDMGALCETLRAASAKIDAFPTPGIRVRAIRVDHVAMADGNPKHGFIDMNVRLRDGRPEDIKKKAITLVFGALKDFMASAMETHSIALSAEIRDIDADLAPKFGNVRDHLESTP